MSAKAVTEEKNVAIKNNEAKTDKLSQSKDRGQSVSSSAMALLNIALLKQCITQGREAFPHYTLMMTLLCLSFVFQITVGVLTLYVSHLSAKQGTKSESTCATILDNVCCCSVRCKPSIKDELSRRQGEPQPSTSKEQLNFNESIPIDFLTVEKVKYQMQKAHKVEESREVCSCLPCEVVDSTLPEDEEEVVHLYEHYKGFSVQVELQQKEAELKLQFIQEATTEASAKLNELKAEKENQNLTLEQFQQQAAKIQETLDEAIASKATYEKARKNLECVSAVGPILRQSAESILRAQLLEKISFWQNVINYILYVVFVLNAFITGLWVDPTETTGATTPVPAVTTYDT